MEFSYSSTWAPLVSSGVWHIEQGKQDMKSEREFVAKNRIKIRQKPQRHDQTGNCSEAYLHHAPATKEVAYTVEC